MRISAAILSIAIILLSSCQKEGSKNSVDSFLNMVTFQSQDKNSSTFTYQAYEDSPEITLNAKDFTGKFHKGQRTMLYYSIHNDLGNNIQDIKVHKPISTFFDSLRITKTENIQKVKSNPIQIKSIWRTGEFINLNCLLQYTGKNRQFYLVIDEATFDNEIVDSYLVDNLMGFEGSFYRQAYGSFFIGAVWRKDKNKTLRVHVVDESFPDVKYYDFNKTN